MNFVGSWLLVMISIALVHSVRVDSSLFFKKKGCDPRCTVNQSNFTDFSSECQTVCADIYIDENCDLPENQLTSLFKNMKHLIGSLVVNGTKLTSGKFLAGLETIVTDHYDIVWTNNQEMVELGLSNLSVIDCRRLEISKNSKMADLGLLNLQTALSSSNFAFYVWLEIYKLSDNFCMPFDQMEVFLAIQNLNLAYVKANYCQPIPTQSDSARIYGDLIINDSNFERNSIKYGNVEAIFGSLVINGTDLENLDFLKSLKYIAPLGSTDDEIESLIICNNPNLIKIMLPSLKRIRTEKFFAIQISGNNEELMYDSKSCYQLQNSLHKIYRASVNGHSCEAIEYKEKRMIKERKAAMVKDFSFIVIGMSLVGMVLLTCIVFWLKKYRTVRPVK
ncbi:hypothetical protein GCK72_020922 [Caenorhabditis remanei]|uniref:Receptor L-domain domain-containing protein n=1 Tax=Caenorhabditis remanei TaxID=31234 RepID=A0A6A5GIK0_CAERE|nr:hypothetical protein GCK72_020922 [Caenorhabditis remanei]KAF1754362.1 hypothetical protein GCK72_020922 [Caenorhabditis remanei]